MINKDWFCYIHIPFCTSKCKYCRFASVWKIDELKIDLYITHLLKEIKNNKIDFKELKSIYFGWWTPWVLRIKHLENIINTLKQNFCFDDNIEITIEATPITVTKQNLEWWKKIWINRLSIWVQSLNDKALIEIWRWEKWDIIKTLNLLTPPSLPLSGEELNISIDFIIWLPYVKAWWVKKDIEYVLNNYSFIKHISVYMLEEYYYPDNWKDISLNPDEYLVEYEEIVEFLKKEWFNGYEISNFSKKWYECKHNKAYWNHSEMLAYWLGAHGFINGERYSNSERFIDYYSKEWKIVEKLDSEDMFLEKIMFNLRTNWLDKSQIEKLDNEKIKYFINDWYLEKNKENICLTNKGVLVLDYILKEIIK